MQVNLRREQRRTVKAIYTLCWQGPNGLSNSVQVQGVDLSESGIRFRCPQDLRPGTKVFIEAQNGNPSGYGVVRHCTPSEAGYLIGLEFNRETKPTVALPGEDLDYYEFLQINPKAEAATIHRIYRFMATRFHPDNPETGDPEKFVLLTRAYEVLSDPERRAEYDATLRGRAAQPIPIFAASDFVNGIEGEVNRRLGVLSLLYQKRRTDCENPKVSLFELETRMGFPREYLDFTTWYLRSKKYITKEDNGDLSLTALGVDYVESNASKIPILQKLLLSGARTATGSGAAADHAPRAADAFIPTPGESANRPELNGAEEDRPSPTM